MMNKNLGVMEEQQELYVLNEKLLEVGYTPELCAHIVQKLMQVDIEKAYRFAMKALSRLEDSKLLSDSYSQWMIVSIIRYFVNKKDYLQVKEQLDHIEKTCKLSEMTQLALVGIMANVAKEENKIKEIFSYASRYIELWNWKQSHKEEVLEQTELDLAIFYEKEYFHEIIHIGAVAANQLKRYKDANRFWNLLPWEEDGFDRTKYQIHFQHTITELQKQKKKDEKFLELIKNEISRTGLTKQKVAQLEQKLFSKENALELDNNYYIEYISILERRGELKNPYGQWFLTVRIRALSKEGKYKELLQQGKLLQENYFLTQTTKIVLAAIVIADAEKEEDYDTIANYVEIYLENWDWIQANKEEALLQTQENSWKFISEEFYFYVVHLAATIANIKKDYELANRYLKRIPWKRENFDSSVYQGILNSTIRGIQEIKDRQYEEKVIILVSLVETLVEASNQLKVNFSLGKLEMAKRFLVEMQEVAITIGTSLDRFIGEGTVTVKLLEQYCELLWNCNNAQSLEECFSLAEIICEAGNLIQENFLREIRKKQKILLFPSKAEDWILFEPYWKEAKQNGDEVYVIPIPYFQKYYDGSFVEEYYEGENFPKNILITKYNEHKYDGKLVDLIVVKDNYHEKHPFYSVHPFYYIDNLKQYAKKIELISDWDGGVGVFNEQMEILRALIEETKEN